MLSEPKSRPAAAALPLDSPCWEPIADLHRRYVEAYDLDPVLMALDIGEALANGKLKNKGRRTIGSKLCWHGVAEEWEEHERHYAPNGLHAHYLEWQKESGFLCPAESGLLHYAWLPDWERRWPQNAVCEEPLAEPEPAPAADDVEAPPLTYNKKRQAAAARKQAKEELKKQVEDAAGAVIVKHPHWTSVDRDACAKVLEKLHPEW